jgi:adenine-specific DNA-methyltransferase
MKRFIKTLNKKYTFTQIESTLIDQFIKNKNLKKNKFFDDYFTNNKTISDPKILKKFKKNTTIDKLFNAFEIMNKDKKISGVYYTSNQIIELMINNIVFKETDKIIDIGCGASNFLYFIGKKIKYQNPSLKMKDIIENNLYGIDNSKLAIIRSGLILNLLMIEFEEYEDINTNLYHTDTLSYQFKQKYDYVIGNPPYVRIQNLEEDTIKHIRNKYRFTKEGNIDIYIVFMEIGLNILKETGKLIYIVSNTFFRSSCCKKFRQFLIKDNIIEKIINLEDIVVFDDTNTYTCIIQMSKNKNDNKIKYHNVTDKNELLLVDEKDTNLPLIDNIVEKVMNKMLPIKKTERINYKEIILRDDGEPFVFINNDFIDKIESLKSLGEYCHINCGIATLADSLFILKADNNLNIEEGILKNIVKASKIKDPNYSNLQIVWPYDDEGKIIKENILKQKYPICYKYLLSIKEKLDKRDKGKINKMGWYAFGRSQGITSSFGKKILTSTMNLKPNFVIMNDINLTFYSGYSIKIKDESTISYNNLQKILNSEIMEKYIKTTSRTYSGGWKSYTKASMIKFGIPELNKNQIKLLTDLKDRNDINKFLNKIYKL